MALQADESPEVFSWLADDLLLEVFSYLNFEDLLLVRGVCRRWWDVAMDRWAWSRRRVVVHGKVGKAALQQAPCAGRLIMLGDSSWWILRSVPSPLPLGYSSLYASVCEVTINWLTAELLRQQRAAVEHGGMLKSLTVVLRMFEADLRPLLRAINECKLESLNMRTGFDPCRYVKPHVPEESGEASLKTLHCHNMVIWPDPFCQYLVTSHAATLTTLSFLGSLEWRFDPDSFSLVSRCTALTHLTCPPFDGMEALRLPSLEHLTLCVRNDHRNCFWSTADFVRRATLLRHLQVESDSLEASEYLALLLKQLATTPGPPPALQTLHISLKEVWGQLADAIKCLKSSWGVAMSLDAFQDLRSSDGTELICEIDDDDIAQCPLCRGNLGGVPCVADDWDEGCPLYGRCCARYDQKRDFISGPPEALSSLLGAAGCLQTLRFQVCAKNLPLLQCPVHPRCGAHPDFTDGALQLQERCDGLASRMDSLRRALCDNPSLHLVGARWVCVGRGRRCDFWPERMPRELRHVPHGMPFNLYGHKDVGTCDAHRGPKLWGLWVKLGDA